MTFTAHELRECAVACAKRQSWPSEFKREEQSVDGSWVFWIDNTPPENEPVERKILVRHDDGEAYALGGAIGGTFQKEPDMLGLPKSDERWVGSGPGKYQLFDKSIVVWDALQSFAYPRFSAWADYRKGRKIPVLVAFFDLRGFTQWSSDDATMPSAVQLVLEKIEARIQLAIQTYIKIGEQAWPRFIFLKGTGDGFMMVLENLEQNFGTLAKAFLETCSSVVKSAKGDLPSELAIGCGIDCGNLKQVFILGQWDYLGEAANNAAKLQQLAWDEICVSKGFYNQLPDCIKQPDASWRKLGKRGYRYIPENS